jgi:hypothetical protein
MDGGILTTEVISHSPVIQIWNPSDPPCNSAVGHVATSNYTCRHV